MQLKPGVTSRCIEPNDCPKHRQPADVLWASCWCYRNQWNESETSVKLNLGCGDRYVLGWHNVDLPNMPHEKDEGVDLAGPLPWAEGSIGCVYAGHVLEHLPLQNAYNLVARLRPLMQRYGPIMLVGPDLNRAREIFPADDVPDEFGITYDMLLRGADRWSGDVHHWGCTSELLEDMLTQGGWQSVVSVDVEEAALLWPVADARPKWQCAVGALAL